MATIYHNPRCGKSREALKILHERGENVTIVEYLKKCPDASTLKGILAKLGIPAHDLIRKNEKIYKEMYKGKELSEDEWIAAMVENPILIERPIVIKDQKAVIGRPKEKLDEIL
jgi:arsenate reductase